MWYIILAVQRCAIGPFKDANLFAPFVVAVHLPRRASAVVAVDTERTLLKCWCRALPSNLLHACFRIRTTHVFAVGEVSYGPPRSERTVKTGVV